MMSFNNKLSKVLREAQLHSDIMSDFDPKHCEYTVYDKQGRCYGATWDDLPEIRAKVYDEDEPDVDDPFASVGDEYGTNEPRDSVLVSVKPSDHSRRGSFIDIVIHRYTTITGNNNILKYPDHITVSWRGFGALSDTICSRDEMATVKYVVDAIAKRILYG